MINSGNIKIRAIEKKEEPKSGKLYTNNYYSYNIDRHMKTDYHNISIEKGEKIHICCFDIVKSQSNKVISKPFLRYLLYKYPDDKKSIGNLCVFPFTKYKSGEILQIGKSLMKKIFNKNQNPLGYIKNSDGVFLFYNIEFESVVVKMIDKTDSYIWSLIDEICNIKKIITFPVHNSVTKLFLENPKLIYLKDKNKKCIEVPTVVYHGGSQEIISYIANLGMRAATVRLFGPYYYFTDFKNSIRAGGWSSNYEKIEMFGKLITDTNGKFNQGGIVRFALFLGNYRVILNRPSDPIYSYVKGLHDESLSKKKKDKLIKKNKGKWTSKYDSLQISNYKNMKGSGYFLHNTEYVTKQYDNYISLSIHLIDKKTLKGNYDPDYDFYDIL
tara:strand:+ start:4496 stop:5647 length:1152 start_codon:yes stop_codon:yes gene_type:complete